MDRNAFCSPQATFEDTKGSTLRFFITKLEQNLGCPRLRERKTLVRGVPAAGLLRLGTKSVEEFSTDSFVYTGDGGLLQKAEATYSVKKTFDSLRIPTKESPVRTNASKPLQAFFLHQPQQLRTPRSVNQQRANLSSSTVEAFRGKYSGYTCHYMPMSSCVTTTL